MDPRAPSLSLSLSLALIGCVASHDPATMIAEPDPPVATSSPPPSPPRRPVPPPVGAWVPRNDSLDVCAWRGGEFVVDDFEVVALSEVDEGCMQYSMCSWQVDVDAEQPRFGLERPSRPWPLPFEVPIDSATGSNGRGMAHRVDDGWLVAFDHGEWGSLVWWYSADGSVRKKLGRDTLLDFYVIGDVIWAPAAEDFRAAEGYMLRFEDGVDGWRALAGPELLTAVPEAATLDGDTLLIVSIEGVEEVDVHGRVTLIAEVDFWNRGQPRYPGSIARARDGRIFVGHTFGVTRLTPAGDGYHEEFLLPPACRETVFDLDGPTLCNCVGLVEATRAAPAALHE